MANEFSLHVPVLLLLSRKSLCPLKWAAIGQLAAYLGEICVNGLNGLKVRVVFFSQSLCLSCFLKPISYTQSSRACLEVKCPMDSPRPKFVPTKPSYVEKDSPIGAVARLRAQYDSPEQAPHVMPLTTSNLANLDVGKPSGGIVVRSKVTPNAAPRKKTALPGAERAETPTFKRPISMALRTPGLPSSRPLNASYLPNDAPPSAVLRHKQSSSLMQQDFPHPPSNFSSSSYTPISASTLDATPTPRRTASDYSDHETTFDSFTTSSSVAKQDTVLVCVRYGFRIYCQI